MSLKKQGNEQTGFLPGPRASGGKGRVSRGSARLPPQIQQLWYDHLKINQRSTAHSEQREGGQRLCLRPGHSTYNSWTPSDCYLSRNSPPWLWHIAAVWILMCLYKTKNASSLKVYLWRSWSAVFVQCLCCFKPTAKWFYFKLGCC